MRAAASTASSAGIPLTDPRAEESEERYKRFAEAIDAIRARVEAEIGRDDVDYVHRVFRFSRAMEVLGRLLIHVSLDPVTFSAGVGALFVHQILELTEGHPVLHGTYDKLPGAERFRSATFKWNVPIDEEAWRTGHNIRHHQYTNIAEKDGDIHFGPVRLTELTPHHLYHEGQLPFFLAILAPGFCAMMNLHFCGWYDFVLGNGRGGFDVIPGRSWESFKEVHVKVLRKFIPYYLKSYGLFPLLAGPMFWKVAFGNWLADLLRDLYSASAIYCAHVGDVELFEAGTRAHGRGEWYAMQVEATQNFQTSPALSFLWGALDLQIEHHLFPRFTTQRLRQIAPEVRAVCEAHGVRYRNDPWSTTLWNAIKHVRKLARSDERRATA
jgi:linoleoyl-CoA desaturase